MTLRDQVKRDIENGLNAEIQTQGGLGGVFFRDANEYIPFSELAYNQDTGYTRRGRPVLLRSDEEPDVTYIRPCNAAGEPITWVGVGMGIACGYFLLSIPLGIILFVLGLILGL